MRMNVFGKLAYFSLAFALFMITPVYAAGNLTATNGTLSAVFATGDFWNTKMNVVLNISFNATVGDVNVSAILVNISGTANTSNITGIFVYNDSNSNAIIDPSETLLGSNTSLNISTNYGFVNFTTNLSVPANTKRNILVAYNISTASFRFNTTAAQISINSSIRTSDAEIADNITISTGSINSTVKQILDMHANATISPRYVDTNVTEQAFVYTITPSGQETINRTKIIIPTGYTLVDVTDVYVGSVFQNRSFDGSVGNNKVGIIMGTTEFNLTTNVGGVSSAIKINFTANTNVTAQTSAAFTSKIFSNISFIDTDVYNEETNVTTSQLVTVQRVTAIKRAALINGTDYWQFNLTLNFTVNSTTGPAAGVIQFRMNNWTNNDGAIPINLTNNTVPNVGGAQFFANLRLANDTNATRQINITENYNGTSGIYFNITRDGDYATNAAHGTKHLILTMTVPGYAPVSTSWFTVYRILFRSNPT